MRVLLGHDGLAAASLIRRSLDYEGHRVDAADRPQDVISMAHSNTYDAIVVDETVAGIAGAEVCARLRRNGQWTPLLLLIASDSESAREAGLKGGADDLLAKPFSLSTLLARLAGIVGPATGTPSTLEVGNLRLDRVTRQVWRAETEIYLSAREISLLEAFMNRPGEALSRDELLERAWEYDYAGQSNVVEVFVRYLREKVDRPFGVTSIETIPGAGYRLRALP